MDIIHQYVIHKYMDNQILLFIFHRIWMISMYIYIWLVVYLPLSSSVGIMTFPTEWKKCSKPPTRLFRNISKIIICIYIYISYYIIEGSLEVKLPTIWTDEKQRWKGSERRERLEERRVEEKESEERRCRCAKR